MIFNVMIEIKIKIIKENQEVEVNKEVEVKDNGQIIEVKIIVMYVTNLVIMHINVIIEITINHIEVILH